MTNHHSDYGDECPDCGAFYDLVSRPPHIPAMLQEYGTDDDIDAWEAGHDYEITECLTCGWSDES